MKPVTSNPALQAYHRVMATRVATTSNVKGPEAVAGVRPAAAEAAHVQISREARELASTAGDVRADKVNELKTAVTEGNFKVNHHLVAQRLVEDLG